MPKKKKGNWVSRLKAGVKYHLSGQAGVDAAKQELKDAKLKRVKAKLAAKKKKAKKPKTSTNRTEGISTRLKKSGLTDKEIKRLRGK